MDYSTGANAVGEKVDHALFDRLSSCKNFQDSVTLHLFQFETSVEKKGKTQEWDYLIFFWRRKLVIGIDAKNKVEIDCDQLIENYYELLVKIFGEQLNGWTFFPAFFVAENPRDIEINDHFIDMKTNIDEWLLRICGHYPEEFSKDPKILNNMKDVLKIMVFILHIGTPIHGSNWVERINNLIEEIPAERVLFYNKPQYKVLKSPKRNKNYHKIILSSGYGCGKTVILKEKAKRLSQIKKYKGHVMYVTVRTIENFHLRHFLDDYSLLYYKLQDELNPNGIIVEEIPYYVSNSPLFEIENFAPGFIVCTIPVIY